MVRISPFATVLVAATLLGATALAADAPPDRSRINGSISIAAGERAGDVETVNGSITLGARAEVSAAETVNGSINTEDGVRAGSLEVVNGSVRVGKGAQISGNVETVNGAVEIGPDSAVAGNVENVNGRLTLRGARVAGNLETVRGDIELADGAHRDRPGQPRGRPPALRAPGRAVRQRPGHGGAHHGRDPDPLQRGEPAPALRLRPAGAPQRARQPRGSRRPPPCAASLTAPAAQGYIGAICFTR